MRKIVVLRPEGIRTGLLEGNESIFADAALEPALQTTPGTTISKKAVVRVSPPKSMNEGLPVDGERPDQQHYAVEVDFADEAAERAFKAANEGLIVGTYHNPAIVPLQTVCPVGPVGGLDNVRQQLNILSLHQAGHQGKGVRIVIADTGVNDLVVSIAGGLTRPGFPAPGEAPAGHGTMVAFDARIGAPEATFLDYPLLHDEGDALDDLLFDAMEVYEALLRDIKDNGEGEQTPMVVVNSWGVSDSSDDPAPGTPGNYGSNPNHPFNQKVAELVAAGADVLFAAGNCGGNCAFPNCAAQNIGAGNGILGANAHDDVITVGAVTVDDDLLGYSSQGPGLIATQKPDLAASSHFEGSGAGAQFSDRGTSAACGVAAGVVAALRSVPGAAAKSPTALKAALLAKARQPHDTAPGWNPKTGHGIIDAEATVTAL